MGGRRSHYDKKKGGGGDAPRKKNTRGFARGHGAHHHHRQGKDAPRGFGTGRDRTGEGTRTKSFGHLGDEDLADLSNYQRHALMGSSVEEPDEARRFGARLEGVATRGTVVEVRKGNFLTRMDEDPPAGAELGDATWNKGELLRTFVRGTLQQFDLGLSSLVAPGDTIEMVVPPMEREGELHRHERHAVLTGVHPRRSEFRRLHPSGRSVQTLAANVDRIYIVASAGQPEFRPGFVDRVLVCAMASGLPAALVLNKTDLGVDAETEELLEVYRKLNISVYKISLAAAGAPQGDFEALRNVLSGYRNLLTGHSGVGKSTLLRALAPHLDEEIVRVGEVSTQTQKGTHTTTHARLFTIDVGDGRSAEVIDTPGVREFTPADTDRRNLWGWFPEIAARQGHCSFGDCTHTIEKGCAILAAVEAGEIHPRRHQSYVRIYQTLPG